MKKTRLQKIKGLNRKVFYKNLKRVLKKEYAEMLPFTFENWVADYEESMFASGRSGWYEIKSCEHKNNYAEEIRTN